MTNCYLIEFIDYDGSYRYLTWMAKDEMRAIELFQKDFPKCEPWNVFLQVDNWSLPKKKFKVQASYTTFVDVVVEAESVEEARKIASEVDSAAFIERGTDALSIDNVFEEPK